MKQIRLSKGLYALVDDEDYDYLMQWSWYASNESRGTKWYAIRRENGVKIRMHRAVIERPRKVWEGIDFSIAQTYIAKGMVVDHINHNSLDNRRENLEIITQRENMKRSPGWKQRKVISATDEEIARAERLLQSRERQTSDASDQSR